MKYKPSVFKYFKSNFQEYMYETFKIFHTCILREINMISRTFNGLFRDKYTRTRRVCFVIYCKEISSSNIKT